jgi:hypothetical protein
MAGEQLSLNGYCVQTTMVYTGMCYPPTPPDSPPACLPWSMPDIREFKVGVGVCAEPEWFVMTDFFTGIEYDLQWVEACGCYAAWEFVSVTEIKYVSMTITKYYDGAWTGALRDGRMYLEAHHPQYWWFDPSYPMITAHVNPELIIPPVALE